MSDGSVELEGLTRHFREGEREHVVIEGLDLRIESGEIVVVVGPSGSGKSTLLNLVSGIDLPDAGAVRIDARRIDALSERERTLFRRRHIGFVFQFFNLIPTLTVGENLLLPVELVGVRDGRDRAIALLERVGLADRWDSYPDRLSGGEQQRVAVARAVVHEPALILADEPTGNLDAATGGRVLEVLEGLARDGGRTLLVATHSEAVVRIADRVLALEGGHLSERR